MKKLRMLMATVLVALSATVAVPTAQAALTTAQAQAEFNSAVKSDAADGLTWRDCGSLHPLISKSANGGWVARGSYVIRGRVCAISTQFCDWYGWLSPSGYWIDRQKYNCR
jgi:hypothetical protein